MGYAETQGTCYSETRPGCKALDSLFSALCLIYQTTELLSLFCKSLSLPYCPEPPSVQQTCCWLCVTSKKTILVPQEKQIPVGSPHRHCCAEQPYTILTSSRCSGHCWEGRRTAASSQTANMGWAGMSWTSSVWQL